VHIHSPGKAQIYLIAFDQLKSKRIHKFFQVLVKPQNILVTENNSCLLCDFGWSKAQTHSGTQNLATQTYAAPELFVALPFELSARPCYDIFSLGYVLWELWTRKKTHESLSHLVNPEAFLALQALHTKQKPPLEIPQDCPWHQLLIRCWDYQPSSRITIKDVYEIIIATT